MEEWFRYFGTEFIGAALIILFGNGVVASINLIDFRRTKPIYGGTGLGWGLAVGIGALTSVALGGVAHLNPAVTFAFVVNNWTTNVGSWGLLPIILLGQALGFFVGQILLDLIFIQQIKLYFKNTSKDFEWHNSNAVLSMHATIPQSKVIWTNCLAEFIGTLVLVMMVFVITKFNVTPIYFPPLIMMMTIMALTYSLNTVSGGAINSFRDLIPRLVYQILVMLPFANKKETANWKYAWVPITMPILAGLTIGSLFLL